MRRALVLTLLGFSLAGLGCVTSPLTTPQSAVPQSTTGGGGGSGGAAGQGPRETEFAGALDEMSRLDRAGSWAEESCAHVAKAFLGAARDKTDNLAVHATFNAGVANERCHKDREAKELFERVLAYKADFHPAKVHLILLRHRESGGRDIDRAVAELRQAAIVDARYKNVEALVALAMLSLERDRGVADADGPSDRARAVRYLQSALAVDDSYLPAMNGLALYYLGEAQAIAGRKGASSAAAGVMSEQTLGTQAMELAALVCTQALRKDPRDALIHNTYGLIQVQLGDLGKAAEAFGRARGLRPGFYEAEMNFAAVNLQFRGFGKAEEAYREVLKSRPNDYDARMGLSLALRGQIKDDNAATLLDEAGKELARAKQIAPDRPEAYYNEAILTQEYKAKGAGGETRKELSEAKSLFGQFIQKAGSAAQYAGEVKSAGERMREIDEVVRFLDASPKNGS